jgi:glycerophosphoryl diester phosphodiesterase
VGEALVIAHRGGPKYAPENTLKAFRNAIGQGVDAIELDVQITRDGELVVIHDESVNRTTDGVGPVGGLALAEIHALDAGEGEHVPTFAEVVEVASAGGVLLFPEMKTPGSTGFNRLLAERMLQDLGERDYLDRSIIQSFHEDALDALRAENEDVQLCALYGLWGFNVGAPAGGAQNVCPMAEMALLYPAMIRKAHGEGRQMYVWFLALESPVSIDLLRFFGADGFMVDDPAAAIQALEK